MLGPVQVLVVGVADAAGAGSLVAAVRALPADGPVRCVDVFECTIGEDGELVLPAAAPVSLPLFADSVDDVAPVPPAEGTWHLGQVVPSGSRAVVALLEHHWALGLRDSMQDARGTIRYESWLDDDDRATLETLLSSG
jgi:hypothetical protein